MKSAGVGARGSIPSDGSPCLGITTWGFHEYELHENLHGHAEVIPSVVLGGMVGGHEFPTVVCIRGHRAWQTCLWEWEERLARNDPISAC
jgi:hypothetical protein